MLVSSVLLSSILIFSFDDWLCGLFKLTSGNKGLIISEDCSLFLTGGVIIYGKFVCYVSCLFISGVKFSYCKSGVTCYSIGLNYFDFSISPFILERSFCLFVSARS